MSPTSHNICFCRSTTHHDLGDEVDDGRGRLLGFKLSKYVALVVGFTGWLPCHKSKAAAEKKVSFSRSCSLVEVQDPINY